MAKLEKGEDLRVRLRPGLKERFDAALEQKRVKQQTGVNELVAWFVEQDSMLQSLILGQIGEEYAGQASELALRRLAELHAGAAEKNKRGRGGQASQRRA